MTEKIEKDPQDGATGGGKRTMDPVRRWTFILLGVALVMLAYYLRADRVTPATSQARVHALVIPIAAEVSGTITSVSISNNQVVSAGQELFQIDTDRYQLAVTNAEANLDAAWQAVGAAEAAVKAARASVDSAVASMTRAEQDAIRMRNIRAEDPGALSERRLESAEAGLAADRGRVDAARANLEQAIQNLGAEGESNARIQQAQTALDQARLNLERSTVRAPEDGVVTGVRLDRGNYVGAGAPQLTFIATHNVWIQADFTENNLGNINPGDEAEIVFDVLPGQVIRGKVNEISFGVSVDSAPLGSLPTIQNDSNWLRQVQRYPVLIQFTMPSAGQSSKLKVGSQATVVIYTGDHYVFNTLAKFYMRLVSILTYAY